MNASKGDQANQERLYKFKDFLCTLMGRSIGVVDAYTEMIRDNESILQQVSVHDIEQIFNYFIEQQKNQGHIGGRSLLYNYY